MRYGIGIGVTSPLCVGPGRTPRDLFRTADAGFWFDPQASGSMSQDLSGLVPVTAPGQPVGRLLDRSGRDTHATQGIAAARPTFARMPKGGRRNLALRTADFSNAVWGKSNITVGGNTITETTATGLHRLTQGNLPVTPGNMHSLSFSARRGSGVRNLEIGIIVGANYTTYRVDLGAGATSSVDNFLGSALSAPSVSVVQEAAEWRVTLSVTVNSGTTCTALAGAVSGTNNTYAGDGVSSLVLSQPQFEVGPRSAYQQVTTAADITETGKASRFALLDDQIDDALGVTLPAGSYTVAFAEDAGITILTGQTLSGAYTLPGPARLYGAVAINRTLSGAETASLTAWLTLRRP